jgi:hypothetical protein
MANRRRGLDLTSDARDLSIARNQSSLKSREISYQLQIAHSTVYSTIQQDPVRDIGNFLS